MTRYTIEPLVEATSEEVWNHFSEHYTVGEFLIDSEEVSGGIWEEDIAVFAGDIAIEEGLDNHQYHELRRAMRDAVERYIESCAPNL